MESSAPVRRTARRFLVLGAIAVAVVALAASTYVWLTARGEGMLADHVSSTWGERVELQRVELVFSDVQLVERPGPHYLAWFRVAGTDATFFAAFPLLTPRSEVDEWGALAYPLDENEVALLTAYSQQTSRPAIDWYDASEMWSDEYPGAEVWEVEAMSLDKSDPWMETDYYRFERDGGGTFRYLDSAAVED